MIDCAYADVGTVPCVILRNLEELFQSLDAVLQPVATQSSVLCKFLNKVVDLLVRQFKPLLAKGYFAHINGIDNACKQAAGHGQGIVRLVHLGVCFQFTVHLGKPLVNLCLRPLRCDCIPFPLVRNLCRNHFFLPRIGLCLLVSCFPNLCILHLLSLARVCFAMFFRPFPSCRKHSIIFRRIFPSFSKKKKKKCIYFPAIRIY